MIYFKRICDEFIHLCNVHLGIDEGIIYSTQSLNKEQIKGVEEIISKITNKDVELHNRLNSRLIGGIRVALNDRVYDNSIRHSLDNLKKQLLERKEQANEN